VRVASPSLYETFIHNTLPAFTGALNGLNGLNVLNRGFKSYWKIRRR